ncbi:MAG: hypothetical protein HY701_10680 [Gemmatimonadetes bacterium]|nr:hypothetical protein [Gemmatimonadota bacterium]
MLGVLFAGTAAGAAAAGLLATKTTVHCIAPLYEGACEDWAIQAQTVERPYLAVGVGAAVGVAIIATIEAYTTAKNRNRRGGSQSAGEASARLLVTLDPQLRLGLRIPL